MVDAMKDAAKQKWRVLEVLSKVVEKASLVWSVIGVESIGKDAIYELSLEKPEDRNTREELGKLARQLLKTTNEKPFSDLVNSRPIIVRNMLKYLPE
jgi:phosphoribosylformylglycinamidine (FGAM) synthase PurS component